MKTKEQDITLNNELYNNTDFSDISHEKNIYYYLKNALFAFLGLCFSQLDALGTMSPFTTAFLAVVKYNYCFSSFLAGAIGYFISHPWQSALKYTISCALVCFFRLAVHKRFKSLISSNFACICAFFCTLIPGIIFLQFTSVNITAIFMLLCESGLSLCAAVFFAKSKKIPLSANTIVCVGIKDKISLAVSICIFLMCMSGFTVEGLSPARIISSLAIMFVSLCRGSSGAAICGVLAGSALCINSSLRYLFPGFAVAGLISGVFSPLGQISVSVAYAVSYCLICLMGNSSSDVLICLVEAVIASAAFMLIPPKRLTYIQELVMKKPAVNDEHINSYVAQKLNTAAENICEVSNVIAGVSDKLDSIINPEVDRLFAKLQQCVCAGCSNKSKCWNKSFDSTASDILYLAGIEKHPAGRLYLEKHCLRYDVLINEIREALPEYTNNIAMKMKVREMRRVLTDQFGAMGDFLKETAKSAHFNRTADTAQSVSIRNALIDSGFYNDALAFYNNSNGKSTVEISLLDHSLSVDRKKLKHILELITGKKFEDLTISTNEIKTTITFEEKAPLQVQFGAKKRPLKKDGLCGDSVCFISCPDGCKAAVISDGMGTGSRAAIDSTMAVGIAEKLISGGFSVPGAIRTVNSAMIMKSTDESIASFDCLMINTYSGKSTFYKSGAAISFIRHENEIRIISSASLPVGIIRNIIPSEETVYLEIGDIVLLVSDGVTANDCSWINDELLSWSTNNMNDLASHITSLAQLRSDRFSKDDISAVAIKITKAQ